MNQKNSCRISYSEKQNLEECKVGTGSKDMCPECGSRMIPQEGCYICMSCGYSSCG